MDWQPCCLGSACIEWQQPGCLLYCVIVAVNPLATSPPVAPTLCTYACISADTKLSTDSDDVCKSSTCFISCATAGAGAKKYLFLRPAQHQPTSEINVTCARQRSANGVCNSSHVRVCDAGSRAHGQATQRSRSHALPVHPQRQARRTATDHGVGHIHTVACHLLHAPTRQPWLACKHTFPLSPATYRHALHKPERAADYGTSGLQRRETTQRGVSSCAGKMRCETPALTASVPNSCLA